MVFRGNQLINKYTIWLTFKINKLKPHKSQNDQKELQK